MPIVPPVVTSRFAGAEGPAYLLAWIRLPDGTWGAQIAWVSIESSDGAWVVRSQIVMADVVTRMDGQDYRRVPVRDARG